MHRPTAPGFHDPVAPVHSSPQAFELRRVLPGYWFDSLTGRESRLDFCLNATLALSFYYAVLWATTITAPALEDALSIKAGLLGAWWVAISLHPLVLHGTRRLHDLGQTGLWSLMLLIPGANLLLTVVLAMQPGESSDTEHDERGPTRSAVLVLKPLLILVTWVGFFYIFRQ